MEIKVRTEVGLVREQNEDSFLICADRGLLVVADGMGGHLAGEIASQLAVQVFNRRIAAGMIYDNPRSLLKNLCGREPTLGRPTIIPVVKAWDYPYGCHDPVQSYPSGARRDSRAYLIRPA